MLTIRDMAFSLLGVAAGLFAAASILAADLPGTETTQADLLTAHLVALFFGLALCVVVGLRASRSKA